VTDLDILLPVLPGGRIKIKSIFAAPVSGAGVLVNCLPSELAPPQRRLER